jgi:hypothetical protein
MQKVVAMLLIAFGLAMAGTPSVRAEEPNANWKVTGKEVTFQAKTTDGRTFTFGFADAKCRDGRTGVVASVYRPNRAVERTIIPAGEMTEFQVGNRAFNKSWLGSILDGIIDVLELGEKFIKETIKDLKDVAQSVKQIIEAMLRIFDRFSSLFSEGAKKAGGSKAVARYALAVQAANAVPGSTLADRMRAAFAETLAGDNRLTVELALTILNYDD